MFDPSRCITLKTGHLWSFVKVSGVLAMAVLGVVSCSDFSNVTDPKEREDIASWFQNGGSSSLPLSISSVEESFSSVQPSSSSSSSISPNSSSIEPPKSSSSIASTISSGTVLPPISSSSNPATSSSVVPISSSATSSSSSSLGWCEQPTFQNIPNCGTFQDIRDDKYYKWVSIDGQKWMAENLAYLDTVNASSDYSETEAKYYVYGYNGQSGIDVEQAKGRANYQKYGVLYNWTAAMGGSSSSDAIPSGVQGVCPQDWHLPSDAEWMKLERFLGMSEADLVKTSERGTVQGLMLRSQDSSWGNTDGRNSVAFEALPGGFYLETQFASINTDAYWWTSTQDGNGSAFFRRISVGSKGGIFRFSQPLLKGYSVRCIKN